MFAELQPITASIDGQDWHGHYLRPSNLDGCAWVSLPGAGETTDIFCVYVDDIQPRTLP